MLYPDIPRIPRQDAGKFFTEQIRGKMPKAVAMGNDLDDGSDEGCGKIDPQRLAKNIRTLVMRSF